MTLWFTGRYPTSHTTEGVRVGLPHKYRLSHGAGTLQLSLKKGSTKSVFVVSSESEDFKRFTVLQTETSLPPYLSVSFVP